MIIEICVAVLTVSFIALVVFLIVTIQSARKDLKRVKKEINALSANGLELVQNLNELTEDLRKKSESLDFIFRFIDSFNKKHRPRGTHHGIQFQKHTEQVAEIIDVIGTSFDLFDRIKSDVKRYVKRR